MRGGVSLCCQNMRYRINKRGHAPESFKAGGCPALHLDIPLLILRYCNHLVKKKVVRGSLTKDAARVYIDTAGRRKDPRGRSPAAGIHTCKKRRCGQNRSLPRQKRRPPPCPAQRVLKAALLRRCTLPPQSAGANPRRAGPLQPFERCRFCAAQFGWNRGAFIASSRDCIKQAGWGVFLLEAGAKHPAGGYGYDQS